MNNTGMKNTGGMSRRELMKAVAGMAAGTVVIPRISTAQGFLAKKGTVRDRLWLFAVPTNADNYWTHKRSVMTPAEGAYYLGVPNIIMVQVPQNPRKHGFQSFESPLEQYATALRPLKRMLWSMTGAGGYTTPDYRREALELAKTTPNCVGLYMDDFFFTGKKQQATGQRAALTVDELKGVRQQAKGSGRKLDIWVTYYTSLLDLPLNDYLELIDVITLWTSKSADLKELESNFRKAGELGPHLRKTLGCYFFDYRINQPLTVADMKSQCEIGLEWLRQGKIEGMVFLDNPMEDVGFECVEWVRDWIRRVGYITV